MANIREWPEEADGGVPSTKDGDEAKASYAVDAMLECLGNLDRVEEEICAVRRRIQEHLDNLRD